MRVILVGLALYHQLVTASLTPDDDCHSCGSECTSAETIGDLWVIPGSHNSGAISPYYWWQWPLFLWAKNQSYSLSEQMNLGMRYLDLRLTPDADNVLYISHTFLTNRSFSSALQEIADFLTKNKTEFILLAVENDFEVEDKAKMIWDGVLEEINLFKSKYKTLFYEPRRSLRSSNVHRNSLKHTLLSDVAGKIILLTTKSDNRSSMFLLVEEEFQLTQLWRDSFFSAVSRLTRYFRESVMTTKLHSIVVDQFFGIPPIVISLFMNGLMELEAFDFSRRDKDRTLGLIAVDGATESLVRTLKEMRSIEGRSRILISWLDYSILVAALLTSAICLGRLLYSNQDLVSPILDPRFQNKLNHV
jgi:hypothetical protein